MRQHRTTLAFNACWLSLPVFLLLLVPVPALAYLDPTTGSMVISAIVGLFASLVLAIKTYWYRIKTFFKGKPGAVDTENDKEGDGGA